MVTPSTVYQARCLGLFGEKSYCGKAITTIPEPPFPPATPPTREQYQSPPPPPPVLAPPAPPRIPFTPADEGLIPVVSPEPFTPVPVSYTLPPPPPPFPPLPPIETPLPPLPPPPPPQ